MMIIKIFFFIISTLLILNIEIHPQSPEDLIEDLYSENLMVVTFAINAIIEQEINEALPAINELFESQPPFLQLAFLRALLVLEDPDVDSKSFDVISNADNFANYDPPLNYDPLNAKAEATLVLLEIQNYNTVDYIFERISRDKPIFDAISLTALEIILNDISAYEQQARTELEYIVNTFPDTSSENYEAFCILIDKYGWQLQNIILNNFENVSYLPIKIKSFEYLTQFNYSGLNSLLKERISIEEFWSLRVDIADSLLKKFGEPSDLKAVIDYQPNEPDETARSLMGFAIDDFIPPKPDTLNWNELAVRLIDYTEEMYGYEWISEEETRDHYLRYLTAIIESITETGQTVAACSMIQTDILERLEEDLSMELVTVEGYKFLHYYTVYIKEEIEENYGACLY